MKKPRKEYDDEPVDDIEEIDDADRSEEGDSEKVETPVTPTETIAAFAAILFSCGMFVECLLRTTLGMYRHRSRAMMQLIAPEVSIRAMEWLLIADLPVIVLAAYALIVTRPHEGSALRGLAIAASALSFINVLLLGNSLSVLLASAH